MGCIALCTLYTFKKLYNPSHSFKYVFAACKFNVKFPFLLLDSAYSQTEALWVQGHDLKSYPKVPAAHPASCTSVRVEIASPPDVQAPLKEAGLDISAPSQHLCNQ